MNLLEISTLSYLRSKRKLVKQLRSTTQLEYLMAVLKEGMRIFPTAPQGTPRVSPGVTVKRHYVPKGGG